MATVELYISTLSGGKYTINTAGISDLISMGREELLPDFFGVMYNKALALFALHHKLKADGGSFNITSGVKSESNGKWSITYGGQSGVIENDPLCSTYFGSMLRQLMNDCSFAPRTQYNENDS